MYAMQIWSTVIGDELEVTKGTNAFTNALHPAYSNITILIKMIVLVFKKF